jgi:hypothetical protein
MNKKLILVLIISLIALLGASVGVTYAWLTSTGSDTIEYTVGDVSYTITAKVDASTIIVPGQNLTSSFEIKNNSNVYTNLRVSVSTSMQGWTIGKAGTAEQPNTTDHILVAINAEGWELVTENNVMYFYYGQKADSGVAGKEDLAPNTAPTTFPFSEFKLNGYKVGNEYSGKTITITITFYAKQADYVTWENLGSFSFETGLPNNAQA